MTYWQSKHEPRYSAIKNAWSGNDPRKASSDSQSFWYYPGSDGEHGGYKYFAGGSGKDEKGSLYDICRELDIEITGKSDNGAEKDNFGLSRVPPDISQSPQKRPNLPEMPRKAVSQPKPSKRAFAGLSAYAAAKGIPVYVYEDWGITEGEFGGEKAMFMPHEDGFVRVRTFGEKPRFQPVKKIKEIKGKNYRCLYGFDKAVTRAIENRLPLVLTNGQPSVIKAQYYALAAFAQTDGEKGLQADLLKRIIDAIHKHDLKIFIALDADEPGRDMAATAKAQFAAHGIDAPVADFGGHNGFDLDDFCSLYKAETMRHLTRLCSYRAGDLRPIVNSEMMRDDFDDFVFYEKGDSAQLAGTGGEVAPMPIPAIRQFGGNARNLLPGMMTAIVAISGGGKTSFIELVIDELMKNYAMDCMIYTPEWTDDKLHHRRIHRYGNGKVTWEQLQDHAAWINETGRGIDKQHCIGKQLTQAQRMEAKAINDRLYKWPGRLHVFQGKQFTEDILDDMKNHLSLLRRYNRRVGLAVFDYIQLMRTNEEQPARSMYETMLAEIKQFSMSYGIHCIVGVQIEKSKAQKKLLDIYDAQWVRPDYFNLIVLPNLCVKSDGQNGDEPEYNIIDIGTGREHIAARVRIGKNSGGRKGVAKMLTDFECLSWCLDKTWKTVNG